MWDSIKLTNAKSRTFLLRYYTQSEIKGFAILKISKIDIKNIEKLRILRTITDGVNSVSSVYTPKVTFFFPDMRIHYFSLKTNVIKALQSQSVFWHISSDERASCIYMEIRTKTMYINVYESGISIEALASANSFFGCSRIFTAIIPFKEIV